MTDAACAVTVTGTGRRILAVSVTVSLFGSVFALSDKGKVRLDSTAQLST